MQERIPITSKPSFSLASVKAEEAERAERTEIALQKLRGMILDERISRNRPDVIGIRLVLDPNILTLSQRAEPGRHLEEAHDAFAYLVRAEGANISSTAYGLFDNADTHSSEYCVALSVLVSDFERLAALRGILRAPGYEFSQDAGKQTSQPVRERVLKDIPNNTSHVPELVKFAKLPDLTQEERRELLDRTTRNEMPREQSRSAILAGFATREDLTAYERQELLRRSAENKIVDSESRSVLLCALAKRSDWDGIQRQVIFERCKELDTPWRDILWETIVRTGLSALSERKPSRRDLADVEPTPIFYRGEPKPSYKMVSVDAENAERAERSEIALQKLRGKILDERISSNQTGFIEIRLVLDPLILYPNILTPSQRADPCRHLKEEHHAFKYLVRVEGVHISSTAYGLFDNADTHNAEYHVALSMPASDFERLAELRRSLQTSIDGSSQEVEKPVAPPVREKQLKDIPSDVSHLEELMAFAKLPDLTKEERRELLDRTTASAMPAYANRADILASFASRKILSAYELQELLRRSTDDEIADEPSRATLLGALAKRSDLDKVQKQIIVQRCKEFESPIWREELWNTIVQSGLSRETPSPSKDRSRFVAHTPKF